MTTVIAYRDIKNNRVLMASDRRVIDGCSKHSLLEPKMYVYDKNPDFVIGCAGTVQLKQILKSELYLPTKEDIDKYKLTIDTMYLTKHIIQSIRSILKDYDEDGEECNRMILAYKDKMWVITGGYSIGSLDEDYIAIGSGENYAIGALRAINKIKPGMDITNQLLTAMEIASEYDIGTDNDIDIAITGEAEIQTDNHDFKTYESNIDNTVYKNYDGEINNGELNNLCKNIVFPIKWISYELYQMQKLSEINKCLQYFIRIEDGTFSNKIYVTDADRQVYMIYASDLTGTVEVQHILSTYDLHKYYQIEPTQKCVDIITNYLKDKK